MEAATDPPRRRRRRKKTEDLTNTNSTTISELPSHITCDILSRLPLNSIFSCKRVCSSFRNLTLEPDFPRLHLPRSPLRLILLRFSHSTISFRFLPLDDLRCPHSSSTMKFEIEIPARRPLSPQSTHHFKVVKFAEEGEQLPFRLHCWVYTLGVDDEWRYLGDTGQPTRRYCDFVFLNGALHWIGLQDSDQLLLCYFDMEKEQCRNHPLPNFSMHSFPLRELCFKLGVVDNCLYIRCSVISQVHVNIWVMKDYENMKSWTLEWMPGLPFGWTVSPVKTLEDGTVSSMNENVKILNLSLLILAGLGRWEVDRNGPLCT
ncbi:hypothetical protein Vadar_007832 [Vaccinium darrowii]|uniref:Uncharacterized protein n=1 Tax=Vaccinium darrowii TaxID=229202 RepID=A0ACB7XPA8_9ERIC|nr:hypothetical protein Vadar_007832 [Vaccinium darrowii]